MFAHATAAAGKGSLCIDGPRLSDSDQKRDMASVFVAGRSDDAEIKLPDRTVSLRHMYVQRYGNLVFVHDLYSANGTKLGGQRLIAGWWAPKKRISVGPFDLTHDVTHDVAPADLPPLPTEFRPRNENHDFYGSLPMVGLELLDKSGSGTVWPINRVITLLGRDSRCRITCGDDSVSLTHCAFVLTASGLWVYDLLSRNGVTINGQKVACGLLSDGFELGVGRYRMRANVEAAPHESVTDLQIPNLSPTSEAVDVGFLTKNNKIFRVEHKGDTLVVTPTGDMHDFFYQDLQQESNIVVRAVTQGPADNVVINFGSVRLVGSIMIEAIAGFCRSARGTAALCCATPEMYSALETTRIPSIWYHYASVEDAVTAVRLNGVS